MIDAGKRSVLGVLVNAIDYDAAVAKIVEAAREGRRLTVSALAVHGVMTGVQDDTHRYRLNHLDLVCPDGQPVRWALNLKHKAALPDRVYGPNLTLRTCEAAAREGLKVFLYGSREEVLTAFSENLQRQFSGLQIVGQKPSLFRPTSAEEKEEIAAEIRASGAQITLVGLGCPRQEVWAYEYGDVLQMPILAVGAAFDFHAGLLPQAPAWMQDRGLEWLFRLVQEPRRLWRRYVLLNPAYAVRFFLQWTGLWKPDVESTTPPQTEMRYG